jgi:hypothetical protein
MPEDVSHFPISKAIAEIMDDQGFSRAEFVRALGYRNVENGLDRLNLWLDDGAGFDRILKQIISVYGHADDISKAIVETKKVKKREHRESRRDVEDLCRRQYNPYPA